MGRAAVPSGASTGAHEAVERRDGDKSRYMGKGVLEAVAAVNGEIAEALVGFDATEQEAIDAAMIEMDGTAQQGPAGRQRHPRRVAGRAPRRRPNAIGQPLFRYVGGTSARVLPVPMMNIINGGEHADNPIDIQEFMIMPVAGRDIRDAVRMGSEVFHTLKKELSAAGHNTGIGDEGGFAPDLSSTREALDFILKRIEKAGYKPGEDIMLALDCASTEYFNDGNYEMKGEGKTLDAGRERRLPRGHWSPTTRSSRSRTAWPRTTGTAGRALTEALGDTRAAGRRRPVRDQPRAPGRGDRAGLRPTRCWSRSTRSAR